MQQLIVELEYCGISQSLQSSKKSLDTGAVKIQVITLQGKSINEKTQWIIMKSEYA